MEFFEKYICFEDVKYSILENYKDINIKKKDCNIRVYKINNYVNNDIFFNLFNGLDLEYGVKGISDTIIGKYNINDFVKLIDNKIEIPEYIFHNVLADTDLYNKIINYIELPSNLTKSNLRISRLYFGSKFSGTYIHQHSPALNYLVKGKKLWIIFPNYIQNMFWMRHNKFDYDSISEKNNITFYNWLIQHIDKLKNNIYGINIFIQNPGETVYIPEQFFHGVLNLEESTGITYSWNYL